MGVLQFKDKTASLELRMVRTNKTKYCPEAHREKMYSFEENEEERWAKIMSFIFIDIWSLVVYFLKKILVVWFGGVMLESRLVYAKVYNGSHYFYVYI